MIVVSEYCRLRSAVCLNVLPCVSVKQVIILELRKNEFIPGAGIVPVYFLQDDFVSGSIL